MSLKKQAIRGLKWTTTASAVSAAIQLLQLFILARLLTKEDFGLMALAMVVVGFSQIFADMGLTNAIIHKKNLAVQQLHTVYFINIGVGLLLSFLLFITAPLVSDFYTQHELTHIIRWLSLIFVIQPFGQIYNALIRKELQFDAIAKRDMFAKIAGFTTSVIMAMMGFGVYSFVGSQLVSISLSVVLLILLGKNMYRPQFSISRSDIKPFLRFSGYQLGDQLVSFTRIQLDVLILGKLMGIESVGLYNMAKRLVDNVVSIINPIVTQVSFPVMAKIQDEQLRLKNIFLKTVSYTTTISFSIYAFIAIFSENIIAIAAGQQWTEAAPLVQILSLYGALRSGFNPTGSLTLAKGFVHRNFWWSLGCLFIMPIFLLLGIPWGVKGIACGVSISHLVILIPLWYFLIRPCILCNLWEYLQTYWKALLTALMLTLTLLPVVLLHHHTSLQLLIGSIIFAGVFLPILKSTNTLLHSELQEQIRDAWKKHFNRK